MGIEDKNQPREPEEPENSIQELVLELRERDEQRKHAVNIAWKRFEEAETEEDIWRAIDNIARMMGVREEFQAQFPEIFPPLSDDSEK